MSLESFLKEPLQGKTSLSRVFWLYGVVGSILYGAIEIFLDPANVHVTQIYVIGGLIFSVYVTAASYQCAVNCRTLLLARLVRVSAVLSLLLLVALTYLELTGALTLAALGGERFPE